MMNEPDQNLRALEGMDGVSVTQMVDGKPYKMGWLTPTDFVSAARWRAEQQGKVILDTTPTNSFMDVSAIKAEAWASVLDKPVDAWKLMGDSQGLLRLGWIAIRRGGEFKGPDNEAGFEFFRTSLPPGGYRDLEQAVFKVSGFRVPEPKKSDAVSTDPPLTYSST